MNHDELLGLLPLYVLGTLDDAETSLVQQHLVQGCDGCEAERRRFEVAVAELGLAMRPITPPSSLRTRVLDAAAKSEPPPEQVWKSWHAQSSEPSGMHLVRAAEGSWETVMVGVTVKQLSTDIDRRMTTMLIRMLPGTSYPSHRHALAEECFVVAGELHVGDDIVMRAGDFQRAEATSVHQRQWTETGCLLVVTSSLEDELLD